MSEHAVRYYQTYTCQTQTKFLRLNSSAGHSLSKSTHKPTSVKPAVIHITTASPTFIQKGTLHTRTNVKGKIHVYRVVRTVLSKKSIIDIYKMKSVLYVAFLGLSELSIDGEDRILFLNKMMRGEK